MPFFSTLLASIFIEVQWKRSINPSVCRWYTVALIFVVPITLYTYSINFDVSRSKSGSEGTPRQFITSSTSNLAMVGYVWSAVAKTSGHFVKLSIKTSVYVIPVLLWENLIISTPIQSKAPPTGVGVKYGLISFPI